MTLKAPAPPRTDIPPDATLRGRAGQNTSDAVMAQRGKQKDSLDDFPTPPWGTRALCEYIIGPANCEQATALEPAANRGYMAEALHEYFSDVYTSDVADYGYPLDNIGDFLSGEVEADSVDWVITNPPFKLAEQFVQRGLKVARVGVAVLCRTVFIETIGRYDRLYSQTPPWRFAPFTERLPMVEGRLDEKASSATSYAWFVWHKFQDRPMLGEYAAPSLPWCPAIWIPPCRAKLEREQDYSAQPKDWFV